MPPVCIEVITTSGKMNESVFAPVKRFANPFGLAQSEILQHAGPGFCLYLGKPNAK